MARFNKRPSGLLVPATTPIVSTPNPAVRTGNSAPGFTRDPKGELFLLAVNNFTGYDTAYETGIARDERFKNLVRQVAKEDSGWIKRFLPWLRTEANMRTASIVGAIEAAVALRDAKIPGGRQLVNSVLQRADEPGEALGYWLITYPDKQIPKPVKRGIADAATRLYNEYNTLKYDTASHAIRFGDVLELTHAGPDKPYQVALFKHLIDRRHGRGGTPESYMGLSMIIENMRIRSQVDTFGNHEILLRSDVLKAAGMTWEDALSLAGDKLPKAKLWEALIPNMGYMALLRNLRNFDEAGISLATAQMVIGRLTDPDAVAKSRQLPMRFLSAMRAAGHNLHWAAALDTALQLSLQNIPAFAGRTLILIDTSGSMGSKMSDRSDLARWDAAAVFGLALAHRCESAEVYSYSNNVKAFPSPRAGTSLLTMLHTFENGFRFGGGTNTLGSIAATYRGHDRVIVLTDEQANWHGGHSVMDPVPNHIPAITFNVAGLRVGHAESGTPTRITIGGLSDACFKLLPVLEARGKGQWPF